MSSEAGGNAPGSADSDSGAPARRPARRLIAWTLTAAAVAALIALAMTRISLSQVGHALARVHGAWIVLAVILMVGAFLARGESWFAALRVALPAQRIGRAAVTRVLLIAMAGSAVAPGRLGEAARAWLITRRAGRARETLTAVIGTLLSQTILNVVALVILAIVALAGSALPGAPTGAIALVAALPAALVILLKLGPGALGRAGTAWPGRLGRAAAWAGRHLSQVRRGLGVLGRPRSAAHSVSFQLGAWAMQWGACYAVILAFGLERRATLAAAAAILLAVNITAVVPLTPSNVGVFQAACIAVLAPFGIRSGSALAYGLVLQAIEVACALVLGGASLAREGITPRELHRRAAETSASASSGPRPPRQPREKGTAGSPCRSCPEG